MNKLFIGLIGVIAAAFSIAAATNTATLETGKPATVKAASSSSAKIDPNDPVEKEYKKIMDEDDAAQAEVDKWIRDNDQFAAQGAGIPAPELKRRIQERFRPVQIAYAEFLKKHPDHARAHLAYGSFLGDMQDEEGAEQEWDKARELDPTNPAVYNNLANVYTHHGPIKKAFEYYAKAIELNTNEPVYYHNYGTAVYLFRKDARQYFGITEQEVFDKCLAIYQQALNLDPTNFPLASDIAQTYYGIKPLRLDAALKAWTNTLAIANDELEREGVYVHFARLNLAGGRLDIAHQQLNRVTNELYAELKGRMLRNLKAQENGDTNSPPPITLGTNAPSAQSLTNKPASTNAPSH